MIFKLQVPIESSEPDAPWYAYNRDRSIKVFVAPVKELEPMPLKSFWHGQYADGVLTLDRPAPWQDW